MNGLSKNGKEGTTFPLASSNHFSISSKFILENEYFRFDPPQYAEDVYRALDVLEHSECEITELGALTETILVPPPVKRHFVNRGEPYLTPTELFDFRPQARKYVLKNLIDDLKSWYVKQDWIVVTQSGSVGKVIHIGKYLEKYVISQNALRVVPNDKSFSGYLFAYLSTWIGQALVKKDRYGASVKHLNPGLLSVIPVPRLKPVMEDNQLVNKEQIIHERIVYATKMRDLANKILDFAETLFYKYSGLPRLNEYDLTFMNGSDKKIFEVTLSDVGLSPELRLDSTNYDPAAKIVDNHLSSSDKKIVALEELAESIVIPPRFKRIYVDKEYGVPFIRPSHLPAIRFFDQGYLSKQFTPNLESYLLNADDVLVTTDGTVGNISVVTDTIEGFFGSNNIARIKPLDKNDTGYIALYLMLPYGRLQLQRQIYGGVIDHINENHIRVVKTPYLSVVERRHISKWVIKAFQLKDKAIELEDLTIRELEGLLVSKG